MNKITTLPLLPISTVPVILGLQQKINLKEESQPYFTHCQIEARNDLEAVSCWLKYRAKNPKTFMAYRREAERFLMWCIYERGLPIGKLKTQDFEAYLRFLQVPPKSWCASRGALRAGKSRDTWRPFVAGLKETTFKMAVRILHSLMNYLVEADYIRANPLKLVEAESQSIYLDERKYQVWERMLEEDEWQAVQQVLEDMPETDESEISKKIKVQFLFALLYFLGLRIHEVVNSNWSAFRYREGKWWFFVRGKRNKLSDIPVHDKLLSFVKVYRLQLGKLPLPLPEEDEPLFISRVTQKPLAARQLFNWVKTIGQKAAQQFEIQPLKQKKLQRLSPHWLRHLFASHLDKEGVSATVIKEIMRHGSIQTTQIYQHAGDMLRHQSVQKIDIRVRPKVAKVKEKPKSLLGIHIILNGGSLSRLASIEKLIVVIEQQVLQGYEYRWQGVDKSQFLERVKKDLVFLKEIKFSYLIAEELDKAQIDNLINQIKVEGEIRLFTSTVEINYYNKSQFKHLPT